MKGRKSRFDDAVMGTLETIDKDVIDEYDSEDVDMLDGDGEEAEMLANQLFEDADNEDCEDNDIRTAHVQSDEDLFEIPIETTNDVSDVPSNSLTTAPNVLEQVEEELVGSQLFYNYPAFDDLSDWFDEGDDSLANCSSNRKGELYKGQRFVSKDAVVHACQVYSLRNRVEYTVDRSEPSLLNLKCRAEVEEGEGCKWHFRAVKKKNSLMFEVTIYEGPHTCESDIVPNDNVHLNKNFIGWEIKEYIHERLRISPRMIKVMMQRKYGFEISYLKAWKGREKAMELLFGF